MVFPRTLIRATTHYPGADGQLRFLQEWHEDYASGLRKGVFEEYRYDALGRRVLVRSRQDQNCTYQCLSTITRYIWAGDQILHELRAPGQAGANLELTMGSGDQFGRRSYVHGGSLDRPLVVEDQTGHAMIPHTNWRGLYDSGTLPSGALLTTHVDWPGRRLLTYLQPMPEAMPRGRWYGSLVAEKTDQSGLMYMRNRYYDPATGQFTRADPIGLAGGLNPFGFASGDPLTYSDPFGLCAIKGAAASVAMGRGIAAATGSEYGAGSLALDVVGGALCAGVVVRGVQLLRGGHRTARGATATRAAGAGDEAFHHTFRSRLASIQTDGLRPGSYATPQGGLSPLQAHIDLALPGGLRDAVVRIDLGGLQAAGFEIPEVTRVGRSFGMPGGGFEMRFPYSVPSEFIKVITP